MATRFTDFATKTALVTGDYFVGHDAGSSGEFRATAQTTASAFATMIRPTWNSAPTTYNALDIDVTNSASAAASQLAKLKIGGAEKFGVTLDGDIRHQAGTILAHSGTTTTIGKSGDTLLSSNAATFTATNIGVGTPTPSYALDVVDSSTTTILISAGDDAAESRLFFGDTTSNTVGRLTYKHDIDALAFHIGGTEHCRFTTDGKFGFGTALPEGIVHIYEGNSGAASDFPHVSYNDLVIEGNDNTGITILTPNGNSGGIAFADPEDNLAGRMLYNHPDGEFRWYIEGNSDPNVVMDSTGMGIGEPNPDELLHITGDSALGTTPPTILIEDEDNSSAWSADDQWARIDFKSNDASGVGVDVRCRIAAVVANNGTPANHGASGMHFFTSTSAARDSFCEINYVGDFQTGRALSLPEIGKAGHSGSASAPSAQTDIARIFAEDNGSGKTRLMVQFQTGSAIQIAIEA